MSLLTHGRGFRPHDREDRPTHSADRCRVRKLYPELSGRRPESPGDEPALSNYHLLPSVRGHLLEEVGRADEARVEYQRAAALTRNSQEKALMRRRTGAPIP
jgi:hypothetical protein